MTNQSSHNKSNDARVAIAAKTEAGVRKFFQLGKKVSKLEKRLSQHGRYGRRVMKRIAKELGVSQSTAEKARDFYRKFTEQQLEELCALRNSKGVGLGVGHVNNLLSVAHVDVRSGLQKQAVRENWSTRKLQHEIATRFGKKSHGGRPPQVAEPHLLPHQIYRFGQHWIRWQSAVLANEASITVLPDEVQKHLRVISREIRKLLESLCKWEIR